MPNAKMKLLVLFIKGLGERYDLSPEDTATLYKHILDWAASLSVQQ